jgi:hypothetical protein
MTHLFAYTRLAVQGPMDSGGIDVQSLGDIVDGCPCHKILSQSVAFI